MLCCAVKSLYVKYTKCGLVPMTGMPHKHFFLSPYLSIQNKATSSKTQQTCDYIHTDGIKKKYGKYCMTRLLFEDTGELDEAA